MKKPSNQAIAFAIIEGATLLTSAAAEVSLYSLVSDSPTHIKLRFWGDFAARFGISVLAAIVGYIAVDCMAHSGWTRLSWVMPLLPILTVSHQKSYLLRGVDTVLGMSTGTNSLMLIKAAKGSKKKKVSFTP